MISPGFAFKPDRDPSSSFDTSSLSNLEPLVVSVAKAII